jgi:hypothetical protein
MYVFGADAEFGARFDFIADVNRRGSVFADAHDRQTRTVIQIFYFFGDFAFDRFGYRRAA